MFVEDQSDISLLYAAQGLRNLVESVKKWMPADDATNRYASSTQEAALRNIERAQKAMERVFEKIATEYALYLPPPSFSERGTRALFKVGLADVWEDQSSSRGNTQRSTNDGD